MNDEMHRVFEAIGELRADMRNMSNKVDSMADSISSLQATKWTARGILAGLTLAGGAVGSQITKLFNGGAQ